MKARFLAGLPLGVLAIVLAIVLSSRTALVAGGSDSSGYLNAAKLFTQGRIVARGGRWYALVAPFERDGLERNLPGRWMQIGNQREYALLRLEPSSPSNTAGPGVP